MRCKVFVLMVVLVSGQLMAGDIYVSPGGDDGNSGRFKGEAFASISQAALVAKAGDVVHIEAGEYAGQVRPSNSGSVGQMITYRAVGDGKVVLTMPERSGPKERDMYAFILEGREYIAIEGITFKDCFGWIYMHKANHNSIVRCVFDGSKTFQSIKVNSGSYNRFVDCDFIKAKPWTTDKREGYGWIPKNQADYIDIWRDSHYNLIEGCRFGEIGHVAIHITGREAGVTATHNIVRNCEFKDPRWKCLGIHSTAYTLIENNVMSGVAADFVQFEGPRVIMRRNIFKGYRDSTGGQPEESLRGAIRLQSVIDYYKNPNTAEHNRIYNNVFYDNDRTITNNSAKLPVFDNVFKNNIFYRNRQNIYLRFSDYTKVNRNYFVNNVIMSMQGGEKVIRLQNDRFTVAEAGSKLPELYRGNMEVDPRFVDGEAGDFRLRGDSPCIDGGAALTHTAGAGEGDIVKVDDALYFCDGFGVIDGDDIIVGGNKPVRVLAVDYEKQTLKLDRVISWQGEEPVNLVYEGDGPDIGCYEYDGSER